MTQAQTDRLNGLAVASMVLGIFAVVIGWILLGIPALLAVIFGHVALSQTKRDGTRGRGQAIAGLTLGYIVIGIWLLLVLTGVIAAIPDL